MQIGPILLLQQRIIIFGLSVRVGSDISSGEWRAGDCQDPTWRHDRPARSAPCR